MIYFQCPKCGKKYSNTKHRDDRFCKLCGTFMQRRLAKEPFDDVWVRKNDSIRARGNNRNKIKKDLTSLVTRYKIASEKKRWGTVSKVAMEIARYNKNLVEIRSIFDELVKPLINDNVFFVADWHQAHPKQGMYNAHWHIKSSTDTWFYNGYDLEYLIKYVLKSKIELHVSASTARLHIFSDKKDEVIDLVERLNKILSE